MRDINRAERLLSLFTSRDSAAGIVGDLSEGRGKRGSLWFWRQVLGTALSLARGALFEAPLVVLGLSAMGLLLMFALQSLGTKAALHVALGPSWTGGRSISVIAGIAVVEISLISGALRAVLPAAQAVHPVLLTAAWVASWIWGQAIPALLLLGAAVARRRQNAQLRPTV